MSTKNNILIQLYQNNLTPTSGSSLAKDMGISRNAIWKSIKELIAQGYLIKSIGRQGYILEVSKLSEPIINSMLTDKNMPIHLLATVDSTNNYAKTLISQGLNGVVISEAQTAGRGRKGRTFYSPEEEGLYLSIILRPTSANKQLTLTTVGASVATMRAIKQVSGIQTSIKWVNDIYFNDKKLVGILTEATMDLETNQIDGLVVGIGVNCNNITFPDELNCATSLAKNGKTIDRNNLASSIINNMVEIFKNLDQCLFMQEYIDNSMILGKDINITIGDTVREAQALGISAKGELIVKYADNTEEYLSYGEASIRPKN